MSKKKESVEPKSDVKDIAAPSGPITKLFQRGSKQARHDLFKLGVAKFKRDMSYVKNKVNLVEIEHVHFFHSISDTTLKANKHCAPVGGHFHECSIAPDEVDELGHPKVVVGPPLHIVSIKIPGGGRLEKIVPLTFDGMVESGPQAGEMVKYHDSHTHNVEYLGSENFNQNSKAEMRRQERINVAGVMDGPPATQAARMEGLTSGKDKDEVRHLLKE